MRQNWGVGRQSIVGPLSREYGTNNGKINVCLYSIIMLDEAHERTLYTDIIVGLLKKVSISVISLNQ